jgi:single-stranded-DNA-specific exonuclease
MPDPTNAATTELQQAAHRAAARLAAAFSAHETVVIVGEYDVDGLSATAILMRLAGATTHAFIPDRFSDDYGLTPTAVARSRERYAPTLLVAVDCGSSAHDTSR